jgi:hypothetical protein
MITRSNPAVGYMAEDVFKANAFTQTICQPTHLGGSLAKGSHFLQRAQWRKQTSDSSNGDP